jgi:RNA polymerase sigma factor (TIGR02999 family)
MRAGKSSEASAGEGSSGLTEVLLSLQTDESGGGDAARRIFELAYDELHHIAAHLMRGERGGHTLQPTALVHEAYCRLVDQTLVQWQTRAQFFGIAARAMRQLLVEHARRKGAAKRGGDWKRVTLDDRLGAAEQSDFETLDLDDALTRLSAMDERMGRIVELRIFGGLTASEAAHVLGVSRRTVLNDWRVAKMWLARELT